jgi:hypothetical protein
MTRYLERELEIMRRIVEKARHLIGLVWIIYVARNYLIRYRLLVCETLDTTDVDENGHSSACMVQLSIAKHSHT